MPTILCVDDDEDDLLFVKEAIQSQERPYKIEEAASGGEAIEYLKKCIKKGQIPCLVLMDMNMPGLDGRQTTRKIREIEPLKDLPIAVFTTSSQASDRLYFEEIGIHFITKPFDYKVFKEKIVDALRRCAAL